MTKPFAWPAVIDADYVERLIPALQATIVTETPTSAVEHDEAFFGPDLANVLLMLLASVLERSSGCSTPQGMRKVAEAAGKELHLLMKDTRRLRLADGMHGGGMH